MVICYFISALLGYLLGSVNMGVILSNKAFKDDIRRHGSGNAGATNMARVFGLLPGIATLFGDALKAVIVMLIGKYLGGEIGYSIAGCACILGHCWPVYFHFKGGKGASVGLAVTFMIHPIVFAITAVIFIVSVIISKRVSVGSVLAALSVPLSSLVLETSTPLMIIAVFAACTVVFQHRPNIRRIFNNTEPEFKLGGAKN